MRTTAHDVSLAETSAGAAGGWSAKPDAVAEADHPHAFPAWTSYA
jgi:hypothetical protein